MKKYKITYWNNGNILVKTVEAENEKQALYIFYTTTACDDIKTVEEIK